jgi:hypothetical protein
MLPYLFIYACSSSDSMASNSRVIADSDWKMWKKAEWYSLRYCPDFCPELLWKSRRTLSRDSWRFEPVITRIRSRRTAYSSATLLLKDVYVCENIFLTLNCNCFGCVCIPAECLLKSLRLYAWCKLRTTERTLLNLLFGSSTNSVQSWLKSSNMNGH